MLSRITILRMTTKTSAININWTQPNDIALSRNEGQLISRSNNRFEIASANTAMPNPAAQK